MTRTGVVSSLAANVAVLSLLVGLAFRSVFHGLYAAVFPALISVQTAFQGAALDPNVLLTFALLLLLFLSFGAAIRWPRRGGLLLVAHLSTLPYFFVSALFLAWGTNS